MRRMIYTRETERTRQTGSLSYLTKTAKMFKKLLSPLVIITQRDNQL